MLTNISLEINPLQMQGHLIKENWLSTKHLLHSFMKIHVVRFNEHGWKLTLELQKDWLGQLKTQTINSKLEVTLQKSLGLQGNGLLFTVYFILYVRYFMQYTLAIKRLWSAVFFLCIHQVCIKLIKSNSKYIYSVIKYIFLF